MSALRSVIDFAIGDAQAERAVPPLETPNAEKKTDNSERNRRFAGPYEHLPCGDKNDLEPRPRG